MKTYLLNTGGQLHVNAAQLSFLTKDIIIAIEKILATGATLVGTPWGNLEYQSRRCGSLLEFAFAKNNLMLTECAVSGDGANHRGWHEFIARFNELQKLNAVAGRPVKTLKAPSTSPWFANFLHMGAGVLTEPEMVTLAHLQLGIAAVFTRNTPPMAASDNQDNGFWKDFNQST